MKIYLNVIKSTIAKQWYMSSFKISDGSAIYVMKNRTIKEIGKELTKMGFPSRVSVGKGLRRSIDKCNDRYFDRNVKIFSHIDKEKVILLQSKYDMRKNSIGHICVNIGISTDDGYRISLSRNEQYFNLGARDDRHGITLKLDFGRVEHRGRNGAYSSPISKVSSLDGIFINEDMVIHSCGGYRAITNGSFYVVKWKNDFGVEWFKFGITGKDDPEIRFRQQYTNHKNNTGESLSYEVVFIDTWDDASIPPKIEHACKALQYAYGQPCDKTDMYDGYTETLPLNAAAAIQAAIENVGKVDSTFISKYPVLSIAA
ncbi:hypothetical protein [Aeromonas rivipollensis]|uniref:Uncharacterized protein n=1 Tax=Aeromonas rivipollensis TaxID=948519 RepID=A0AAW9YDR9_9GAMM|nr:hypothetical protein [Aeromonas rivipollensis]NEX74811.1 hypothetical protein [Aeromonas rivipollensis]